MTIRKTIHPEPIDVDVEISLEDVMRTLRESPESQREAAQVLNSLAIAMRGMTDEIIAEFTPAARTVVSNFLTEQLARFTP